MERPVWGWGGWGRNRVFDTSGRDVSVTDGMWVIYLGVYGLVGLVAWTALLLLPSYLFLIRYPVRSWATPEVAPLGDPCHASGHLHHRLFDECISQSRLWRDDRRADRCHAIERTVHERCRGSPAERSAYPTGPPPIWR